MGVVEKIAEAGAVHERDVEANVVLNQPHILRLDTDRGRNLQRVRILAVVDLGEEERVEEGGFPEPGLT